MLYRFIKTILRYQFGEIVEFVGGVLLENGPQTLHQLVEKSERAHKISEAQVKKSLMALIQHEVVTATAAFPASTTTSTPTTTPADEKAPGTPPTTPTVEVKGKPDVRKRKRIVDEGAEEQPQQQPQTPVREVKKQPTTSKSHVMWYSLDIRAVRCRPLLPKYIIHMKEVFGREGEVIMETFAQRGKLLKDQLMDFCLPRFGGEERSAVLPRLNQVFTAMVSNKYLRRAKAMTFLGSAGGNQPPAGLDPTASFRITKSKKGTKKKKVVKKKPRKKKRSEDGDEDEEEEEEEEEEEDDGNEEDEAPMSSSMIRTQREEKEDDSIYENSQGVYWTIGHEVFLIDLRHIDIVQFTQKRISPSAGAIVKAMVETYPRSLHEPLPVIDSTRISELLAQEKDIPHIPSEELEEFLEEMSSPSVGLLTVQELGYVVNVRSIVQELKERHAQSIIKEKYGVVGGRIFKLLLSQKYLEEKQITEFATASKQATRETLYSMLRDGFLALQEIPKTNERIPARTFYLWHVPLAKVHERLLESFMFSWCNIRVRADSETKKVQPLIDKLNFSESITEGEKVEIDKWKKGNDRMEQALLQLDHLIMLFQDY